MEQFLVSVARSETRRSRPTRRALIAVAAGAAAVSVAIGAAIAFNGTSDAPGRVAARSVHVHLVDFSVDTNPSGTVTVVLSQGQIHDPDALRQALAQAGVPAKITIGAVCYNPGLPDRGRAFEGFAIQPGSGETSKVVITPSNVPAGSTLAIAYSVPNGFAKPRFSMLIAGAPVTCSTNPPPMPPGDHVKVPPA